MPIAESIAITALIIESTLNWTLHFHHLYYTSNCMSSCRSVEQTPPSTPTLPRPPLLRQSTPRFQRPLSPTRFRLKPPI
jgi:hypothetical protein